MSWWPEHLDIWDAENTINIDDTEALILHIKVVNMKRTKLTVFCTFDGANEKQHNLLYQGKLPRKDLSLQLPIAKEGKFEFDVAFAGNGQEHFRIWGQYQNERGDNKNTE